MLSGTLDPATLARVPFPREYRRDDTWVVQAAWEVAGIDGRALLPAALHPTAPMLVSVLAFDGQAQVRLSCRHGARARALVVAVTDRAEFDDARLRVGGGAAVVDLGPAVRTLDPGDVQWVTGLWPVDMDDRGLRLVQQEVEIDPRSVVRHAATVETWDAAWPAPVSLVGAAVVRGRVHLPTPRFVARADVPAFAGSERL